MIIRDNDFEEKFLKKDENYFFIFILMLSVILQQKIGVAWENLPYVKISCHSRVPLYHWSKLSWAQDHFRAEHFRPKSWFLQSGFDFRPLPMQDTSSSLSYSWSVTGSKFIWYFTATLFLHIDLVKVGQYFHVFILVRDKILLSVWKFCASFRFISNKIMFVGWSLKDKFRKLIVFHLDLFTYRYKVFLSIFHKFQIPPINKGLQF